MRLRLGHWPSASQSRGTILLFSGRTEYLEKYGQAVADMVGQGYDVLSIDWRGQGYSDRVAQDPRIGHVDVFEDYQKDVSVLLDNARRLELPKPWFLVAHSLGGAIGLRALLNGLPVEKAAFSAPMWDIFVPPRLRFFAGILPGLARRLGVVMRPVPGTSIRNHVEATRFEDNLLTTDPAQYKHLINQVTTVPEFALGGPSFHWFEVARSETASFRGAPMPAIPMRVYVGTEESIVDAKAIAAIQVRWANSELITVPGAKHEIMFETPDKRAVFMGGMFDLFGRP